MRSSAIAGAILILVGLIILYVLRGLLVKVIVELLGVLALVIGIILILVGLALIFGRWRAGWRMRRYFGSVTTTEV